MITIKKLANKARKKNWELTEKEAIQVFEIIPEGCERYNKTIFTSMSSAKIIQILNIKGLGEFEIK